MQASAPARRNVFADAGIRASAPILPHRASKSALRDSVPAPHVYSSLKELGMRWININSLADGLKEEPPACIEKCCRSLQSPPPINSRAEAPVALSRWSV